MVEAVNATGDFIHPYFVAAGRVIQERWFDNNLSDETQIGVTKSGYINDEHALKWIKHFERHTRPENLEEYRLLICDNYGSHTFFEFLEFANQHRIIVIGLPPHTSHLLQPLDVVLFQPYKHWHKQAILQATRTRYTQFNLMEFFCSITDIRNNTFKESSIRASFRQAGIWPVDVEKIVQRLHVEFSNLDIEKNFKDMNENALNVLYLLYGAIDRVEAKEAGILGPVTANDLPVTPQTVRTLQRAGDYLKKRLYNELSSPLEGVLLRFIKGSNIQAATGAQALFDLHDTEAATRARKQRSQSKAGLQKGGVLIASKARAIVKEKQQERTLKAQK